MGVTLYWSGVSRIFDFHATDSDSTKHQLMMFNALVECDVEGQHMNSIVAQAMISEAWDAVKVRYRVAKMLDFMVLIVLFHVSSLTHRGESPGMEILIILAVMSAYQLVGQTLEIITGLRVLGRDSVTIFFSGWSILRVVAELSTSAILVNIAYQKLISDIDLIQQEPVTLMFIIFARWGQLFMALMTSHWYGP